MSLDAQVQRRRTFAIISHPDAGKTTLTEKFLLYGGAVQLAGSVTARRNQRATTSDWMELEKQRGISISSTVLQFEYHGYAINLVDTPGHEDFSEDTYRVLTAVDSAVMVIDAAKGIEARTRKLFEICRQRGLPIFTFMNKCDRPGRDPLALVDEVERILGIGVYPMNWPLGLGAEFRGVYDRIGRVAHLYERTPGGKYRAPLQLSGITDKVVREKLGDDEARRVTEELEMLDGAGAVFDQTEVRAGRLTPVYFGSALNNFGVQLLLDGYLDLAPPPTPRQSRLGPVSPNSPVFSGFVFKIQANMDPNHRDRVAFVRICSGRFERDMSVTHVQTGRSLRLSFSHKLFGRDRETSDEAYPGDVIGIAGHAGLHIGDTLSADPRIAYDPIPQFPPECFVFLHNEDTKNLKRFRAGLEQLLQEKVIQRFNLPDAAHSVPLLGAVGPLQFDVVRYRLQDEYRAPVRLEATTWTIIRWLDPRAPADALADRVFPNGVQPARDDAGRAVLLFPNEWTLLFFREKNADLPLLERAPETTPDADEVTGGRRKRSRLNAV